MQQGRHGTSVTRLGGVGFKGSRGRGKGRGWRGPQLCIRAPSLSLHPSDAPSALQDAAYHCTAALFYLSASVLEALATITMQDGFTYRHYHENIAAVVSLGTRGCVHSGRLRGWQGVCGGCPGPLFSAQ